MSRPRKSLVPLVAVVVLGLAGCGSTGKEASSPTPTATPTPSASATASATPSATPSPSATPTEPTLSTTSVYFLKGEHVQPAARSVEGPGVAAGAVRWLLTGPTRSERAAGLTSSVPAGTALRGVTIHSGLATVDLSGRFGSGGGSLSMRTRLAQVVFTLTQFPTVQRVSFWLDGKPATTLGGEGVVIDKPQTRADYEEFTPAVLVESPRWGADVRTPLTVTGSANVFEAVFYVELRGPRGNVLVRKRVQASSGTGTRGTFTTVLSWTAGDPGAGTLRTFVSSARDGSRQDITSVPVRVRS